MHSSDNKNHDLFSDQWIFYVVLLIPIFVAAVLAWIWPLVPSGDGPYQTLNWIARIQMGQIPGRDFDVFHGIGVIWYHSLLALPFDSARGIIWIHYIGSLFAQALLWCLVFRVIAPTWRKSILYGIALSGAMLLSTGIPIANVALFCSAGHSMIGARVAFPLIMLLLAFRYREQRLMLKAVIFGLASGVGAWFSTDQAIAALGMSLVGITFFSVSASKSIWLIVLRTGLCVALTIGVALASYCGLLWLSTDGSVALSLSYWWKILPNVQFWYFGGAPNPYIHQISDIFEVSVLFLTFVSLMLHVLGFLWRKPGQWGMRLGLLAYGLISMLPLLGMYFPHYIAGLWCTGLIGLIYCKVPSKFVEMYRNLICMRSIQVVFAMGCLVLIGRMFQVQFKNNSRNKNPQELECHVVNHNDFHKNSLVPDFVKMEMENQNSPNLLRAFYRAMPEVALNQSGVGRYDYIIHALGEKQQNEYRETLEDAPPLFLRVPSQKGFSYAQWIWHHWPELWVSILSRYQMEDIHAGSAYWKRKDSPIALEFRALPVEFSQGTEGVLIRANAVASQNQVWRLRVTYVTKPIHGPLGNAVDRLTRVTVSSTGTIDDQSFSWEPGEERQIREVLLVPRVGSVVEIRIVGEGPLLSSGLIVESVELEECGGADVEGVVRMFEG